MKGDLLLSTTIDGRRAAIASCDVQSVVDLEQIVPVPRAPDHVAGLAALRSRALTVIDVRAAIGLPRHDYGEEPRAAVVRVDGHDYALLLDRVDDVVEALSGIEEVEASFGSEWDRVAQGMVETEAGPALLLDIEVLVTGRDLTGSAQRAA